LSSASCFDYIIVGSGLAGLQLALKLNSDSFFENKSIAIIDALNKNTNDKTWSFWDLKNSQWEAIIYKFWKSAEIYTKSRHIKLPLTPYQYNSIQSIDFYNYALKVLKKNDCIHFIKDKVIDITENEVTKVITSKKKYVATHVFDSRIPEDFFKSNTNSINIIQHFKGIVIETEKDSFNPDSFVMMDYRLKDNNQTTFTYVLPLSKNKALIEFTYFTETVVDESVYDMFIKQYINEYLKIDDYTITETEKGEIPMTNFPFYKYNTKSITKIGTGGGWVKPSSGYSFKITEKKVAKIVENLKSRELPSKHLFKKKYRFYDKVFLNVLKDFNYKGEWVFEQFYSKNRTKTMFRFLDEESSLLEDIQIMLSLFSWCFIKSFFKTL